MISTQAFPVQPFFALFNMKLEKVTLMYCGIDPETEINATTDFNDVTQVDFCVDTNQ